MLPMNPGGYPGHVEALNYQRESWGELQRFESPSFAAQGIRNAKVTEAADAVMVRVMRSGHNGHAII